MSTRRKPAGSSTRLGTLRTKIDQLDEKIQEMISERAQCAQEIAATKQQAGEANFYRPEREVDVLRRVIARNRGPLVPLKTSTCGWSFCLNWEGASIRHTTRSQSGICFITPLS